MGDTLSDIFLYSYFGAVIWIAVGVWLIRFIIENPAEDKLSQGGDMKGWAGGIGLIALGIVIIVLKIMGKL